ncbi:MAG TPA: hypothetical protein VMV29_13795 [Ktedonobacterales bacterium]|nr:hypothetical protein [Ktedonobacterales bacterium]
MSMTLEAPLTATSVKERSAAATRHLCETLQLDTLAPKDLTYLALALTEVASEEAEHNSEFNRRVRELYEMIAPTKKPAKPRSPSSWQRPTKEELMKPLKAVGTVDPSRIAPYAPPDPYALLELFGPEQLPRVLFLRTLENLKRAVRIVQARHPGTKPSNMGRKDAIVEYIMRYVTEPAEAKSQAV